MQCVMMTLQSDASLFQLGSIPPHWRNTAIALTVRWSVPFSSLGPDDDWTRSRRSALVALTCGVLQEHATGVFCPGGSLRSFRDPTRIGHNGELALTDVLDTGRQLLIVQGEVTSDTGEVGARG